MAKIAQLYVIQLINHVQTVKLNAKGKLIQTIALYQHNVCQP